MTILTKLTREAALQVLDIGEVFAKETCFANEGYDRDRVWSLLEATVTVPDKRFIAYDSELRGFIIMGISEHYFSGVKKAADFCLYIKPEHRGGSLVVRLLQAAQNWAYANGAKDITIYHSTGINTEKAPRLFNKLGFNMEGYIFTKGLDNVQAN